jgi:GR25 family glycosyltransferase involved in LPS biosynthesis
MELNDFFDEIYCINLEDREDRWLEVQEEFKKLNIKAKRFKAIKNENGALGCKQSHLKIIQEAKDRNLKNILIFEDDVKFVTVDDIHLVIDSTLKQLNDLNWNMFYFGASIHPELGIIEKVSNNILKTNFAYTTHAYAVNSNVFDYILTESLNNNSSIDVFYSEKVVGDLQNSFVINPMIAIQNIGYSDIIKKEVDYYWFLKFFNILKKKFNID